MIYAETDAAVEHERARFTSVNEASDGLFNHCAFPWLAVESVAHEERPRANQGGISWTVEDAGRTRLQEVVDPCEIRFGAQGVKLQRWLDIRIWSTRRTRLRTHQDAGWRRVNCSTS